MLVPPQFYNGEIVVDLDDTIFHIEAEKILELYRQGLYNFLFENGNSKSGDDTGLGSAVSLDRRIRDLKKDRLKKMGYTIQSVSILVTFFLIYSAFKEIIQRIRLGGKGRIAQE
ncbi:conserved Plasmodium protein, unknown function [Plasmodium vivax]|uniref:Uncharacterized protein n=5 Tax=Plasmodium vivax TaxID=5855 RepID=A5K706_PLAVS|nr:hypothetical protein, conserved [Plasmodium vivax]KMZ81120.1 hypothetical protein PVIIG_02602 [Plasmodium vivax India VII]KMZ93792.1 hypothetical protein PVMG_05045 [Plasmodium vivax Mauritania I]KNA00494.1 hypothetical protein PVNG_01128 [Plasmodium vivax North Korean]EDL45097.1 hypothetical protein, conserved [Plasmodium vivax]CAG9480664.1 unnamed protein product [Plasmodium vivax]|eukprot:XP_001614824.1 hypothetical protein [Plasmodium vivax Sal-1]